MFDLVHRREAAKPNQIWQADHTLLDLWVITLMTLAESPQSCSAEFPTLLGVRLRDLRLVVLSSSDQFSVCATPR